MYYEARTHSRKPVTDAAAAAAAIKAGTIYSNDALTYPAKDGGSIFIVPDGHIDSPWFEVAVIHEDAATKERKQIESITAGWIKTPDELAAYFTDAEVDLPCSRKKANLTVDGDPIEGKVATFQCSCCGVRFRGNMQEQLKHDQDAGYGYCASCTALYH